MKILLTVVSIISWSVTAVYAGMTGVKGPNEYLSALPSPPSAGCVVTAEEIERFKEEFFATKKELDDEVGGRRRAMKKWLESNSKKMQENAVDMPGFQGKSQAEMKKMSKAEKRKMAEKMMEEKFGVSMQELKDQKKAQKEGKVGANVDWAKAMAGEQQANDLMKSKDEVNAGKQKITDNIALAREQAELTKKTVGLRTAMQERVTELEKDEQGLSLKSRLEKEQKTLDKMMNEGAPCDRLDQQEERITGARDNYCSYMGPKFLKALKAYQASIETSISHHRRLDEVMSEMQQNQVGVPLPRESVGLSGLETVQDYARYLGEAYKYMSRDPSAPAGSHCDGDAGTITP
ncbi:MAG: hypothetical protein C4530_21465 [Desulfobacteraceae bacterium]|nr:MAG: hypothetical protein C4530_21465 [Desulfobacteraceae bacterium]